MPPEEAAALSLAAQKHVLALEPWACARTVLLYADRHGETATGLLISQGLDQGKRVLLPRCLHDIRGFMEAAGIRCLADLVPGLHGILEPDPRTCPADSSLPELIVVPGLAFDRRGFRLGHGGGYYDRFLAEMDTEPRPVTIGLAYGFQVLDHLPDDRWDRGVQCVCTEEGCRWTPW